MTDPPSYPYRFERTATAAELQDRFGRLEPGTDSGNEARVAGRIRTFRTHGKVAFADLEDGSGRVQLFAQHAVLGDEALDFFQSLSVGDIVGAEGEVVKTRRGELSVKVTSVSLLAECLRPMPEKWHGMTDVEARYRQRYLDLIVNPQARAVVDARATANTTIRKFLEDRGFVEVETPLLQPIAGGAVARPFVTHLNALDIDLYLRVAPELYLKRLLIGGLERVYELNRSFRNEGISARHNPEFVMLEAYEAYVDYNDTMNLVEDLVKALAEAVTGTLQVRRGDEVIDLARPFRRISMFQAIEEASGHNLLGLWERGDEAGLRTHAKELDVRLDDRWTPGKVVAEIYEQAVERNLTQPTFVTGFPKEVSPLAKDHRLIEGFTEHADLVIDGTEMAPIYSELNDPEEQRRRFEQQAQVRAEGQVEAALPDEEYLEALAYGMPPAGGFGLGVERLMATLLDLPSLREVIIFPTLRPEN
jgi:lysyl-tRNA synthetase class 2